MNSNLNKNYHRKHTFINIVTIILSPNIISTDKFAKICLCLQTMTIWRRHCKHFIFIIFTFAKENFHPGSVLQHNGASASSKLCYYYIVQKKKFVCRHNFTYLPQRKIYLIPQFKTRYIYRAVHTHTSYTKFIVLF